MKEFERKDLAIKFCDTPLVLFHISNRRKVRPLQEVVEYFLLQLNQQRFAVSGGRRRILQEIQPSSRRSIITTIRHGRVQLLKHRDRIGSILKERDQIKQRTLAARRRQARRGTPPSLPAASP